MALEPGERFPDLELPDHTGRVRTLAELAGGDPLVLVFSRGWWCPKEQRYLRELTGLQDEFEVAYTRIVVVSVDPPEVQAAFRAGLGARLPSCPTRERDWLPRLGLLETTDTAARPYRPAGFTLFPTSRSTAPTTATGSGAAPRWRSCARTCGPSRGRCARTGRCRRRERRGAPRSPTWSSTASA